MPSHILKWGLYTAVAFFAGSAAVLAQDPAPLGLPPGNSTISPAVDHLYSVILWITGIVFIGVEGLLVYFCIRYRRRPGGRPGYTHGNNLAEIIWTASPALILVFIAFYQFGTWKAAKIDPPDVNDPKVVTIQTFAHTFAWQFRYPGEDKAIDTDDDVISTARFWLPIGKTAYMPLRSIDVIHSFFLFQMRVKQDAVPGLVNHVWFQPTGFYVAKIDKSAGLFNLKFKENWRPKDAKKKWEGDHRFQFVKDDREFQEKFGSYPVVIDSALQYQDGLFRASNDNQLCTVIQNDQVREGVPWRDAEYTIVPYQGTCAELCGMNHFTMAFEMMVLPTTAYAYMVGNDDYHTVNQPDDVLTFWKQWKEGPVKKQPK